MKPSNACCSGESCACVLGNGKGEWSFVYITQINEQEYTLLNKGARFLQTGQLETWNPPRTRSMRQDETIDVAWMWYDEDDLHFRNNYDVEYSIGFGKLVCFRYTGNEIEAQSIWMDQFGLVEPFSKNTSQLVLRNTLLAGNY